jgi:hypothetical protein
VTFSLPCDEPSRYCIEYSNGTLHDVLTFELIVVLAAVFAIMGYLRASTIYQSEQQSSEAGSNSSSASLLEHDNNATSHENSGRGGGVSA